MKKTIALLYTAFFLPAIAFSQDQNYVQTTTYKTDMGSPIDAPSPAQAAQTITYLDGLGRPIQQRAHRQSPTGKDLVTHFAYDPFGRQAKEYLPYPAQSASLAYDANAGTAVGGFYSMPPAGIEPTANSYSEKLFENSPLNRVLKQAAPGADWAMGSGHEIKMDYDSNSASDVVRLYKAVSQWQPTQELYTTTLTLALGTTGSYSPGELYKTVTKDENWTSGNLHTTEEFKDKEGRILLKRNYVATIVEDATRIVRVDTYYVYDQFGNLSFVIPPDAAGMSHQTMLDNKCYQYRYDKRNRLVEKKLPAKQWEFIVYDRLDRPVAIGPANSPFLDLAPAIGWLITKYDDHNRICYTAWMPSTTATSAGRNDLQNARDLMLKNQSENRLPGSSDTSVNGVSFRYTNNIWPTSGYHVLTVNYYDDYNFPNGPSSFPDVEEEPVYYSLSKKPSGMPTGSWARVLEASTTYAGETSYVLYDKKGRTIQQKTANYMGGYTRTDSKLDFLGKTIYSVAYHKRTDSDTELNIREDFTYSEQDRLLSHMHKINNNPAQLMVRNEYDELGRLSRKSVGSGDETGAAALQKVDYAYNVRGWLKGINDTGSLGDTAGDHADLFAFSVYYNTPIAAQPLFNGNISETGWRTSSDDKTRRYAYSYDALNRLTNAAYIKEDMTTGSYNESIQYDQIGNITMLQRNGGLDSDSGTYVQIDDLYYQYDAKNRLEYVEDFSADPQGFNDGSSDYPEYSYDANGNMTKDLNKGITQIIYNHMNLPMKIIFGSEAWKIEYLYTADGRKVRKTAPYLDSNIGGGIGAMTMEYFGGFHYQDGMLRFFPTAEGYVEATPAKAGGYSYSYVFNYTDHLGNIRLSYAEDPQAPWALRILEENHYYPFGLKHTNYNSDLLAFRERDPGPGLVLMSPFLNPVPQFPYNYKYNGKEFQDEMGLNLYDYGARNYDPAIGRWMNIDPLAEKSRRFSPYTYALNNPVYFIDPDGMESEGWIERDLNGQRTMTYDPAINNVNEANAAGYTKVTNVYESATIKSTSGDYSYDLQANGTVTNTGDGSQVEFHKRIAGGSAFETPGGTKIYSPNTSIQVPPQGGAIEPMDFSSPLFPASGIFKSLSASSAAVPRVFWSGGDVAKGAAAEFAASNGMKTLEMTTSGSIMNTISPALPRSISNPIWNRLSSNFASGASGEVNFFTTTAGPRASSIWTTVERPILESNGVNIVTNTINP